MDNLGFLYRCWLSIKTALSRPRQQLPPTTTNHTIRQPRPTESTHQPSEHRDAENRSVAVTGGGVSPRGTISTEVSALQFEEQSREGLPEPTAISATPAHHQTDDNHDDSNRSATLLEANLPLPGSSDAQEHTQILGQGSIELTLNEASTVSRSATQQAASSLAGTPTQVNRSATPTIGIDERFIYHPRARIMQQQTGKSKNNQATKKGQSGLFEDLVDAFTGKPLIETEGIYQCRNCRVYYQASSYQELVIRFNRKCLDCEGQDIIQITQVPHKPSDNRVSSSDVQIGSRLYHRSFGHGQVVSINENGIMEVSFGGERKRFLLSEWQRYFILE